MSITLPEAPTEYGVTIKVRRNRNIITRTLQAAVWEMTFGRCWYCGTHLNPFSTFSIDHVVPLSLGGEDQIENMVPCCRYCNTAKRNRLVHEWAENFARREELDEEPWIHSSGKFWFDRDDFASEWRADAIRDYRHAERKAST